MDPQPEKQEVPKDRNSPAGQKEQFDAGIQALARALRISFAVLTVVMVLLILGYLASGFYAVGPQELALRLHFGKIAGVGADRVLGPGIHWAWPYPVDEVVKIPAMQSQSVGVNTFWYSTPSDLADSALREEREEMRRELKGERVKGAGGCNLTADLNVVHTYWMVTYNIEDPVLYLQNVLVEEGRDEKELIKHAVERAVVQAVAGVGVYDALYLKTRELATAVTRLAQEKLRSTGVAAGVQIQQVLNSPPPVPPPSVRAAFSEASAARQEMKQSVEKALGYRAEQLTQAAGLVGLEVDDPLDRRGLGDLFTELGEAQEGLRKLSRLRAEIQKANDALAKAPEKERAPWEATLAELRKEVAGLEAREKECEAKATELPAKIDKLYARAGAEVERIRNEAQEYKRRLVESAKGDADVISSLVAQFPGEPEKLRTWRDHYLLQQIEEVLAEAEQLYVVHEGTSGKDQVLSIQLTPPIELIKKQRKLEETH